MDDAPTETQRRAPDHLAGVRFPTTRHERVRAARRSGAPADVVAAMENLPEQWYGSVESVVRGLRPPRGDPPGHGRRRFLRRR